MPSECYVSLFVFRLSVPFLFGPSKVEVGELQDVNQAAGDIVAVGEDPHLQGAVCSAGEDAIPRPRLHLHHTGADVAEDGLLGMLAAEGVHEPVAG